jgi:hypothetical protein
MPPALVPRTQSLLHAERGLFRGRTPVRQPNLADLQPIVVPARQTATQRRLGRNAGPQGVLQPEPIVVGANFSRRAAQARREVSCAAASADCPHPRPDRSLK